MSNWLIDWLFNFNGHVNLSRFILFLDIRELLLKFISINFIFI